MEVEHDRTGQMGHPDPNTQVDIICDHLTRKKSIWLSNWQLELTRKVRGFGQFSTVSNRKIPSMRAEAVAITSKEPETEHFVIKTETQSNHLEAR